MRDKIQNWKDALRLAWHINKEMPPRNGGWYTIRFQIKLNPTLRGKEIDNGTE